MRCVSAETPDALRAASREPRSAGDPPANSRAGRLSLRVSATGYAWVICAKSAHSEVDARLTLPDPPLSDGDILLRGWTSIELLTNPGNEISKSVAERAGFTREGVLRRYRRRHGVPEDLAMYSLLDIDLG